MLIKQARWMQPDSRLWNLESSFEQLLNSYLNLRIKLGSSNFSLQRFWLSYLEMTELLLSLIYSVSLKKWDLLLECIRSIIPFTFTYDHVNYARYLPALLGEMLSLEDGYPYIYERFKAGEFSAQLSDESSFSRCKTDKVIEMTLNKDTKPPVVQLDFQLVLTQLEDGRWMLSTKPNWEPLFANM